MKGIAITDIQLKHGNVIPINTEVNIIIPNRYPEIAFVKTINKNQHINFRLKTEDLRDYFHII